jgi:hypothetical protein
MFATSTSSAHLPNRKKGCKPSVSYVSRTRHFCIPKLYGCGLKSKYALMHHYGGSNNVPKDKIIDFLDIKRMIQASTISLFENFKKYIYKF